jgi:TatA/E family protein of Tat protein translocase
MQGRAGTPRQERGIAMEFFGIGMPELMVILVIAIVIFGPDKIPQMAAQVGKAIRDFRRYTSDLTKEFNDATGGLKDEFTNIVGDIRGELAQAQADLRSQLDLTDVLRMDTPAADTVTASVVAGTTAAALESPEPAVLPAPQPVALPAETASPPPLTITTPAVESPAAAEQTAVAANGNGVEPLATKADPFADLAVLTLDGTAATQTTTYVATEPISFASAEPEPVTASVAEPEPIIVANGTNGHTPRVGGSVSGSRYARRRSV